MIRNCGEAAVALVSPKQIHLNWHSFIIIINVWYEVNLTDLVARHL
jgi:hypothetical protein